MFPPGADFKISKFQIRCQFILSFTFTFQLPPKCEGDFKVIQVHPNDDDDDDLEWLPPPPLCVVSPPRMILWSLKIVHNDQFFPRSSAMLPHHDRDEHLMIQNYQWSSTTMMLIIWCKYNVWWLDANWTGYLWEDLKNLEKVGRTELNYSVTTPPS